MDAERARERRGGDARSRPRGRSQTAARLGRPRPLVIAVTVLTSLDQAAVVVNRRVCHAARSRPAARAAAQDAGLDGVVASPQETAAIREACGQDFVIVTPGIRGGAAASGPTISSGR